MLRSIVFALLVTLALSARVKFKNCGSKGATINGIDVDPCVGAPVGCRLQRGTNVSISVTFTPNKIAKNVTSVVHGIVAGVEVPFVLPNPLGCKDSGLKCPLAAGKKYTYKSALAIKSVYPKINVIVKWELQDETGTDLTCFKIRARIFDPLK